MDEYYRNLESVFSAASEIYDSRILGNFINVNIRTIELHTLLKYSNNSFEILEVGCGTGEEASKFIQATGKKLIGVDISPEMLRFARNKMSMLGVGNMFETINLPAWSLRKIDRQLDLIYSFNGALNTEPRIKEAGDAMYDVLKDGGVLILSVRNRRCFGETIIYKVLGRNQFIERREKATTEVEVVGRSVKSFYYSPKEILKLFNRFKLREMIGLAILLPPYLAGKVRSSLVKGGIRNGEKILARLPPFTSLGDETLYVFQKE